MERKKLLYITSEFRLPTGTGAQLRQANLIKQYAREYDITFLGIEFKSENPCLLSTFLARYTVAYHFSPPFQDSFSRLESFTRIRLPKIVQEFPLRTLQAGLEAIIKTYGRFDLIHIHTLGCIHLVKDDLGRRIWSKHYVVDLDSSEYSMRRLHARRFTKSPLLRIKRILEVERVRLYERRWLPHLDVVFMSSPNEIEPTQERVPGCRVALVQNGFDLEAKNISDTGAPTEVLLFVGTLSYEPNCQALDFLAKEVMPCLRTYRPNIRLLQVGSHTASSGERFSDCRGLDLVGYVREISEAYMAARIVLAPVFQVSGTNIKILEAAAHGKPIVTTSLGASNFQFMNGRDLLVADSAGEFCQAIERLLVSPDDANRIGQNARMAVERMYSWRVSGDQMLAALSDLRLRRRYSS